MSSALILYKIGSREDTWPFWTRAHFELHDVGVQRAEAVVQQLPRHNALHVRAALNELYRHLLPRLQVECQLHETRRSAAHACDTRRFLNKR